MEDDANTADAVSAVFELVKFANSNTSSENSKEYLDDILKTISVYFYKDIRIETDCMASIHGEKTDMITMMCNQEDDIPLEKRYINEIY